MFSKLLFLLLVPYILASDSFATSAGFTSTPFESDTTPHSSGSSTRSSSYSSSPIHSTSPFRFPTQSGPFTIPISTYPFTPFPTPTLLPDPPLFTDTDPLHPPPVSSVPVIVPNFAPAWSVAYSKAQALISRYTIKQKVNITTGVAWTNVPSTCVGNIPPVAGFPGLCLQDSPLGVRFTDLVTSFLAGMTTASTWNRTLFRARGFAMGQEFKAKGVNLALGPMAAYETILGMLAGGVQATAKHFINNEQEWMRTQESSNVDDRTQHEIYSQPFLGSAMAGVSSVMCSYNLVDYTYACNNNKILNDVLKREFGFQGFVMSNWFATMSTLSAVAGLDMTMPGDTTLDWGTSYFGDNSTAFVKNQTISLARLDV